MLLFSCFFSVCFVSGVSFASLWCFIVGGVFLLLFPGVSLLLFCWCFYFFCSCFVLFCFLFLVVFVLCCCFLAFWGVFFVLVLSVDLYSSCVFFFRFVCLLLFSGFVSWRVFCLLFLVCIRSGCIPFLFFWCLFCDLCFLCLSPGLFVIFVSSGVCLFFLVSLYLVFSVLVSLALFFLLFFLFVLVFFLFVAFVL